MQEEAYLAKERMAKEIGRRRRLKKLEKEIKIASAVKCFLSESEDEAKDRLFHLPMLLSIQHSHSSTQIRQLVQSELGSILNSPAIKSGDAEAFDSFALSVQSLVGMLRTLEGTVGYELRCGSHVDRLLSKMSPVHRDGFVASRSKQDQQAVTLLQTTSERVSIDGIQRYATPLLRRQSSTTLLAPPDAAMPSLRRIERRLAKDPARAASYRKEMDKLVQAGYVAETPSDIVSKSTESCFLTLPSAPPGSSFFERQLPLFTGRLMQAPLQHAQQITFYKRRSCCCRRLKKTVFPKK
uniref:Uncharacterized protein n=1 Tax=Knipowitschia caucasica TaxID=637954 RepID=A0AAV2MHW6_KNICA